MFQTINTPEFWDDEYKNQTYSYSETNVFPFFRKLFGDSSIDKSVNILIPGAGNADEAQYLHQLGFKNVYVLDFAPTPIAQFKERIPSFPKENIILDDFFKFGTQTKYFNKFDYILEKAFFCALTPNLREDYVNTIYQLLKDDGVLCGNFINGNSEKSLQDNNKPPFGCEIDEYKILFEKQFNILLMKAGKGSNLILKLSKNKRDV